MAWNLPWLLPRPSRQKGQIKTCFYVKAMSSKTGRPGACCHLLYWQSTGLHERLYDIIPYVKADQQVSSEVGTVTKSMPAVKPRRRRPPDLRLLFLTTRMSVSTLLKVSRLYLKGWAIKHVWLWPWMSVGAVLKLRCRNKNRNAKNTADTLRNRLFFFCSCLAS